MDSYANLKLLIRVIQQIILIENHLRLKCLSVLFINRTFLNSERPA